MKNKRGITLVALIITIIVLLILAGVVINMTLGNDGIISKAQGAVDAYKNAQEQEEQMLNTAWGYMEGTIGNQSGQTGNGTGNTNFNSCTINISNRGVISVTGITNMKSFVIYKDNKWLDITKESTYQLVTTLGQTVYIYIIAMDEDENLYKSNIVPYTAQITYLYNDGNQCIGMSGGWTYNKDTNTSVDLTSNDYMLAVTTASAWSVVNINTVNPVDITGYQTLKADVTIIDLWSAGNRKVSLRIEFWGWIK